MDEHREIQESKSPFSSYNRDYQMPRVWLCISTEVTGLGNISTFYFSEKERTTIVSLGLLNNVNYREGPGDSHCGGLQAGGERNHTLISAHTNGSVVRSLDVKDTASGKPKGQGTREVF